ncbi:MAG TPA: DUF4254 domain-containing protein [Ktedonobacteraceae bacterium]|nr:DUF4254 domain-containing protein [Ktedonobacteraceae bacterium]
MDRDFKLSGEAIIELHDRLTRDWHSAPPKPEVREADDWLAQVARQHRANIDLWHIEDEARTPGATDAALAEVKRRIDRTNQLRNDLAEGLDRTLLQWLAAMALPNVSAPLHSESPGLMIDRLSILSLKIYHTREETERRDASRNHVERNQERLAVLQEQRTDLAHCLDTFWRETLSGTRRFKIYRQMKMYNDPSLNPAIYRSTNPEKGT